MLNILLVNTKDVMDKYLNEFIGYLINQKGVSKNSLIIHQGFKGYSILKQHLFTT